MLADVGPDIFFFPVAHWRQVGSNNPQERLTKEIRRWTDPVVIFSKQAAVQRLLRALLVQQRDEWQVVRRSLPALAVDVGAKPALGALVPLSAGATRSISLGDALSPLDGPRRT